MDDEFPARRILDEDVKEKRFKVEWDGVNPETGRSWSPTWEPYEYVSDVLVNEWASKKRRRSDVDFQKASRAALRDFDIKRNRTETPSEEEYVSPVEDAADVWTARYSAEAERQSKQKAKPKAKQKSVASGSGSSYKPSNQSTKSTQASTELSTLISSGSLRALQSQKAKKKSSGPSPATGKRRRQDDSNTSLQRSRPSLKKSRVDDARIPSSEDSDEESDVPVVSSRARLASNNGEASQEDPTEQSQPIPRLTAIPESLRLRTASTSVSTITHSSSVANTDDIFSKNSTSDRPERLPPSSRHVDISDDDTGRPGPSNAAREAQSARNGKARLVSQPLSQKRSDDGPSRLAESNLPSFTKGVNNAGAIPKETFSGHRRRPSTAITEIQPEWALLDTAGREALSNGSNESPSVIQDSAPPNDRTISPALSPKRNGSSNGTEGSPVREPWRHTRPPGSRLVHANIEKPRMPIKVPEPSVFRPVLESTQMTEDIHQFSSQASPPEGSSSEEVLRDLTTQSQVVVERAFPSNNAKQGVSAEPFVAVPAYDGFEAFDTAQGASLHVTTEQEPHDVSTDAFTQANDFFHENEVPGAQESQEAPPISGQDSTGVQAPPVQYNDEPVPTTSVQTESARVLGPPETVETSTKERAAMTLIRNSTLLTSEDTRQDLIIFVESAGFYCTQQRPLMQQPSWDFELEQNSEEQGQSSWHLVIDMTIPDWKLERRVREYVTVSGDEGNNQVMSLYNDLLTAHAALKTENDALMLKGGQLEKELSFIREQDRTKGQKMEELAAEKRRLDEEVRLLHQQVTLGVKQVELIWSAKEKKLKQELDTAKKQLGFAQELIRESKIETLRATAAEVEELKARERDRILAHKAERRLRNTQHTSLYTQFVSSLNAGQSGIGVPGAGAASSSNPAIPGNGQSEVESEDGDFVDGSSSGSDDGSSDISDSSDDEGPVAPPQQIPVDFSGVQYEALPAADLVNAALASVEGILPGGLASISPAPVNLVTASATIEQVNTSGDTTEMTTSASIEIPSALAGTKFESQHSTLSSGLAIESEDILELDSGILESQLAYACTWGKASGLECRKLFSSQKDLYDHVVDEHATPDAWM